MPSFASDALVPGSERAVENVGDRLMQDIVRDLGHGPARLPSVHPDSQSPRPAVAGETPLKPPSGVALIDQLCDAADAQDRLQKIETLSRIVAAGQEAEIARLRAENERLQAELKKAESSAITTAGQE
jgi:hypothetical protein